METGTLPIARSYLRAADGTLTQVRMCVKSAHGHYGHAWTLLTGEHVSGDIVTVLTYEDLRALLDGHEQERDCGY